MKTIAIPTFTICALLASCGEPQKADQQDTAAPSRDTIALAQLAIPDGERVTPDNFCRAETDMYFANMVKAGGLGRLVHKRDVADIHEQAVVRTNRDTYYSTAVFDLDAGPVSIALPDAKGRFMSLLVVDQDHYVVGVAYDAKPHTFTREQVGTRYLHAVVRTFVDPSDPKDVEQAHGLQDGITVQQPGGPGSFEVPKWDTTSQKKVREALGALGATLTEYERAFGARNEVDPVRHLIGTALGWGGNPEKDATYRDETPAQNDGRTNYALHVKDVPVDGFWSITVYDEKGFFVPNPQNAYSLNNITAKKNADGSVDIRFGGCDGSDPNCLPIVKGWNYTVRMYRPRTEILDGTWKFPVAQPTN